MRWLWVVIAFGGCVADDVDKGGSPSDTDTAATSGADPAAALQGDWISQGDDLSPLFQSSFFNLVTITATFNDDGSYAVESTDASGTVVDYAGTYTVDVGTDPGSIVLEQSQPSTTTAEGIWQVDDSGVLTYEVVQTTPDAGFTAPTPETGFGSTAGPGLNPDDNVQVFRRP